LINKDKILITGCAGFIGFHLTKSLLEDGFTILGVDNINDYYDVKLKKSRLKILKDSKNFSFEKVDISNKKHITEIFQAFKPNKVVNLAAQAGVRYSIENPFAYLESNIIGLMQKIEQVLI